MSSFSNKRSMLEDELAMSMNKNIMASQVEGMVKSAELQSGLESLASAANILDNIGYVKASSILTHMIEKISEG